MRILVSGENAEYIASLIATALAADGIESINAAHQEGIVPLRGEYNRVLIEATTQPLPGGVAEHYVEQVKP